MPQSQFILGALSPLSAHLAMPVMATTAVLKRLSFCLVALLFTSFPLLTNAAQISLALCQWCTPTFRVGLMLGVLASQAVGTTVLRPIP